MENEGKYTKEALDSFLLENPGTYDALTLGENPQSRGKYLKNRIENAFFAGANAGQEINEKLRKETIDQKNRDGGRITIPEYAVALARVASRRSEDPYRKVGAVALDHHNRVIGTAYNGLAPGYNAPEGFWDDRGERQKFMLHAEINLCSLFRRNEARIIATTTMPCTSCMQTLCAYGVEEIYYIENYPGSESPLIAERYGILMRQIIED